MKIEPNNATILRSGVQEEHNFTVKATGKAFEILSSGLYTDPILAVIRELCCNARDAHVALSEHTGNDHSSIPFLVHLPNHTEPFFEVTDYGIGMSEDDILNVYTTYFESTKDNSNSFIGALGLGSKSPFAYADSFQVTSRWDKVKTVYSIFLNEERIPSIAKMSEVDTIEENGIAVRLSIKPQDFSNFETKMSYILKYFPTKPDVIGGSGGFVFESIPDNPIRGDGWFVDTQRNYYGSNFIAVMGGVPYKVNVDHIKDHITKQTLAFVKTVKIVADFALGDLNVPPSREEIRYDDKSIAFLANKCRNIQLELVARLEDRVAELEHLPDWESFQAISKYASESLQVGHYGLSRFVDENDVTNALLKRYMKTTGKIHGDAQQWKHHEFRWYRRPRARASNMGHFKHETIYNIAPSTETCVVILDVGSGGIKRMFNWLMQQNYQNIYAIRPRDLKNTSADKTTELDDILEQLGSPTVVRTSDMPTLPKVTRDKTATTSVKVTFVRFTDTRGRGSRSKLIFQSIPDDEAPTTGLYYLCSRGTTPRFGTDSKSGKVHWRNYFDLKMDHMISIINNAKGTEYTAKDVYGVNGPQCRSIIYKDPKWINIFELVNECLPTMHGAVETHARLKVTENFLNATDSYTHDILTGYLKTLPIDSVMKTALMPLVTDVSASKDKLDLVDTAVELDNILNAGGFRPSSDNKKRIFKHEPAIPYYDVKELETTYPMLTYTDNRSYSRRHDIQTYKQAFDYITLVDGQNT